MLFYAPILIFKYKECSILNVSESVAVYVQKLLAYTRDGRFVHGLSTRAGLGMVRAAQAFALLRGASAVLPEHVQAVFVPVAWHRLQGHTLDSAAHEQEVRAVLGQVDVPL